MDEVLGSTRWIGCGRWGWRHLERRQLEGPRDREPQEGLNTITSTKMNSSGATQPNTAHSRLGKPFPSSRRFPPSARFRRPVRCKREPAAKKPPCRPSQSCPMPDLDTDPRSRPTGVAHRRERRRVIPTLRLASLQTQILARRLRAGAAQSAPQAGIRQHGDVRGYFFTRRALGLCAAPQLWDHELRRSWFEGGAAARETGVVSFTSAPLTAGLSDRLARAGERSSFP